MKCSIVRNTSTNKIEKVLAPNGKESKLYKDIVDSLPDSIELDAYISNQLRNGFITDTSKEEIGLAIWSKVYTDKFKQWFGDSKVVDENGEPILMYHGTDSKFNTFDSNKTRVFSDVKRKGGMYFTNSSESSNNWGKNIMPVFIKATEPKAVSFDEFKEGDKKGDSIYAEFDLNSKKGFNVIKNIEFDLAVFEPNQIKSIFNEGEFELESGNIYYDLNTDEVSKVNPELERRINAFLKTIGVDVRRVNKIKNRKGKPINAFGKAVLTEKLIELAENRSATTFPEEAAHMITAMINPNDTMLREMMNVIDQYEVYDEVKKKYANVYQTEEEFRFEAVGKLIGRIIVNKENQNGPKEKNWLRIIITKLQRIFSRGNVNEAKEIHKEFVSIAEAIRTGKSKSLIQKIKKSNGLSQKQDLIKVANKYEANHLGYLKRQVNPSLVMQDLRAAGIYDITVVPAERRDGFQFNRNGNRINPFKTGFYDLGTTTSQENLNTSLNETQSRLTEIKDNLKEKARYFIDNSKFLKKRVSDAQKKIFNRGKTKKQIEEMENSFMSKLSRKAGTELHSVNEKLFQLGLKNNEFSNLESGSPLGTINENYDESMLDLSVIQQAKSTINSLANSINSVQKSIDPNGKAQVYLEQFIMDEGRDIGGTIDVLVVYSDGSVGLYDYKFINFKPGQKEIHFLKEESYSSQIAEYKKMLNEVHGVNNFRASRIIPFHTQYEYDTAKKKYTGRVKSLTSFTSGHKLLNPLPVANELTQHKKVNNILNMLFEQKSIVKKKLKKSYNTDSFDKYKTELYALNESIKAIQLSGDFKPLIETIDTVIRKEASDIKDIELANINELNQLESQIIALNPVYDELMNVLTDKELIQKTANLGSSFKGVQRMINNKREELLLNEFSDIADTELGLGQLETFSYTSEIDNSAFRALSKIMNTVNGNKNRLVLEFSEKLQEKHDALKEWASSKGMGIFDAFAKLTNDKGNLVSKISKEFYNERENAFDSGNIKWLKENYKINEDFDKQYKEDLANFKKVLKDANLNENGDIYKYKLDNWIKVNNLKDSNTAWYNKFTLSKYATIKNESNHYSEEYKYIAENEALKNYYDFYVETNRGFNKLVDDKIDGNFVANVRADLTQAIISGHNVGGIKTAMLENLKSIAQMHQEDGFMSDEDENVIPLLYKNPVRNKSIDLTLNMQLFAESVFNKAEVSRVEGLVESIKRYIADKKVYKTNKLGQVVFNQETKQYELSDDLGKTVSLFDQHVRFYIYGEKYQGKDLTFGNNYSAKKIISSAHKMFAFNSLALQYVSATANIFGAGTNLYMKSSSGKYYNRTHIKNSLKWIASNAEGGKALKVAKLFNVSEASWNRKIALKMSSDYIGKHMTTENAFAIWKRPDDFIDTMTLVSMAQNYGIDPNTKQVQRLSQLPEGTKSIYDLVEIKDKKAEINLEDAQFDDFRRKVTFIARRLKGTNNTGEISAIQTTLLGKTFIFFKNWLPPMAKERFDSIKYISDLNEFEYGRLRAVFKTVISERFNAIPKLMLNIVTLGKIKYQMSNEQLNEHFQGFLEKNPQLQGKIKLDDYIQIRQDALQEGLLELRIGLGLFLALAALSADWDDDGKPDYKNSKLGKEIYKIMNRTYLELSFFYNIGSVIEIIKNPIAIMGMLDNMRRAGLNLGDEALDTIFPKRDEMEEDNTPAFHYTKRIVTPLSPVLKFLEDFQE